MYDQNLKQGTTLQGGKYRIERVLGQGGFGITYRAMMRETVSGKLGSMEIEVPVAIKEFFMKDNCLRNEDSSYVSVPTTGSKAIVEQYRKKFVKEAKNLSNLKHPNIVQVIDVFQENGTDYYVMEYLEGGSLRDLVKREGKLDETKALGYITLIGNALSYMHTEKHLCHYDVKPSNIVLDKKGTPTLIDFGISKNYDEEGNQTSSTPIGISEGFAPIEQYQKSVQEFSPQTDVYALGATLYYLLSGKVPPEASVILNDGLPALSYAISKSTRDAIEQAMQPIKKNRPQSMKAFLELLQGKDVALPKPVVPAPKGEDAEEDEGTCPAKEGPEMVSKPTIHSSPTEPNVETPPSSQPPVKKINPKAQEHEGMSFLTGCVLCVILLFGFIFFIIAIVFVFDDSDSTSSINSIPEATTISPQAQSADGDNRRTVRPVVDSKSSDSALVVSTQEKETSSVIVKMKNNMVHVQGGSFLMGATNSESPSNEKPIHLVVLSDFSICKYEVSQEEWEAVMNTNPSINKGQLNPVDNVSWDDCLLFIKQLNKLTGLNFRLPTEAEWEYAAKGGLLSRNTDYSGSSSVSIAAWYDFNSNGRTHEVGTSISNELGLFDMSGNVWEWCSDWEGRYSSESQTNPQGPSYGTARIIRGGGFNSSNTMCRTSTRSSRNPSYRDRQLGFRLAL